MSVCVRVPSTRAHERGDLLRAETPSPQARLSEQGAGTNTNKVVGHLPPNLHHTLHERMSVKSRQTKTSLSSIKYNQPVIWCSVHLLLVILFACKIRSESDQNKARELKSSLRALVGAFVSSVFFAFLKDA